MNDAVFLHVFKKSGDCYVTIMPHKGTNKYSFVNITNHHICNCMFNSAEEAIADIDARQAKGELRYKVIN